MDETRKEEEVAKNKGGRPRKRNQTPRKKQVPARRCPAKSRALKKLYKDPVFKARHLIGLQRAHAARKGKSRLNVPDGWTLGQAQMQRVHDGIKADLILDRMKADGMVDDTKPGDFEVIKVLHQGELIEVRVPKTEAGMAEAALREAVIGVVSPLTAHKDRPTYIRTVLEWTKPKPATTSNVNLGSEDWLEAALKDNNGDRAGEGSAS